MKSDRTLYYIVFIALLGTYIFCRRADRVAVWPRVSRHQENPVRMASLGYNVFRYQLAAYVIAGGIGGLSGVSAGERDRIRQPRLYVVAAFRRIDHHDPAGRHRHAAWRDPRRGGFLLAEEWLSALTEQWKMIFGPLLILVVLFCARAVWLNLARG